MITRRQLLATGIAAVCTASSRATASQPHASFEVTHPDAEWRKLLTAAQYDVLRREGTERAFTSSLLNEKRRGTFAWRQISPAARQPV